MDRVNSSITAVKSDVIGICQVSSVVRGVVTATRGNRLLQAAQALLARLYKRAGQAGRMWLHRHRPFALAAAWSLAPASAGTTGQRRRARGRRPGSRGRVGRFLG